VRKRDGRLILRAGEKVSIGTHLSTQKYLLLLSTYEIKYNYLGTLLTLIFVCAHHSVYNMYCIIIMVVAMTA
jgi:hypothetical protein